MKKNEGFTLVEMLGVLIILIIIFMIMFPALTKMIKNTNDNINTATISIIESATADFLTEKSDLYPKRDDYTYCITLTQLIDNANLTEKQISSLDDTDMIVKTTFVDNKPVYEITKTCSAVSIDVDFVLLGENKMSIEVGDGGQYIEPGAMAKNSAGEIIPFYTNITNSNKEILDYVDTTKKDTYLVEYYAFIDGKDYSIKRYVKVVDTTGPIITVNPATVTLLVTESTYNVLSGVTASDNSGETPTITARTNLSLKQAGTYTVTYTAEDSSGNENTANRTIIVNELPTYANGTVVYFNPVTGLKCDLVAYTANTGASSTGNKLGCMKWYIINYNGLANANLILDHNTTATIAWNSTGSNITGPTNVLTQLASDTAAWSSTLSVDISNNIKQVSNNGSSTYTLNYTGYKARLITASEVSAITGFSSWTASSSFYYFDTKTTTASTTCKSGNITGCKYGWLYDRTATNCTTYGCLNNASVTTVGFWTSTAVANSTASAWRVRSDGSMYSDNISLTTFNGVRPVITVAKSILN